MLKLKTISPILLIALAGYSQKVRRSSTVSSAKNNGDSLYVVLRIKNKIKAGEKINLQFIVHNDHSTVSTFCKWHTPFEPLMSRYLDVRDVDGNEVVYKGPKAKRIMPPSSDSYLILNPLDTLSSEIDLQKIYQLEAGKKYTIIYNSSGISGLNAVNLATFTIEK